MIVHRRITSWQSAQYSFKKQPENPLVGGNLPAKRLVVCLGILAYLFSLSSNAQACDENVFLKFNPGIQLAKSVDEARTQAREQGKLVLLIASSYRSVSDSDAISPALETFRAGPLVDGRVVKLINRRFVPYYFEMDALATMYDKSAAEIMVRTISELRFSATMPTPPFVVMTADGKSLGDVSVFSTADKLLESLALLLHESAEHSQLNDSEKSLDVIEQANILFELRDLDAAIEMLGNDQSSAAWFLRGMIACERSDWAEMKGAFRMVTDESYFSGMEIQEIHRLWATGNYQALKSRVSTLSEEFPFWDEATYYAGLAYYHSDEIERALEIWEKGITTHPESPWALRMDWTRGIAKYGPERPLMMNHRPESLLGRRFLSPHSAWDLKPR